MTDGNAEPFDWRSYARANGIPPMHAWLACQQAFRTAYPHGVNVTSPASLDKIAADPAMRDVIRATIDDAKAS